MLWATLGRRVTIHGAAACTCLARGFGAVLEKGLERRLKYVERALQEVEEEGTYGLATQPESPS